MNEDTLLQQLKDIQLPPSPSLWPLAPGWYFIIFIWLLALSIAGYLVYRYLKKQRYRKAALKELAQLQAATNNATLLNALSTLLRRTVIAAYPQRQVAGLSGEDWLQFLNETGRSQQFTTDLGRQLLTAPYQPNRSADEAQALFELVRGWMLRH